MWSICKITSGTASPAYRTRWQHTTKPMRSAWISFCKRWGELLRYNSVAVTPLLISVSSFIDPALITTETTSSNWISTSGSWSMRGYNKRRLTRSWPFSVRPVLHAVCTECIVTCCMYWVYSYGYMYAVCTECIVYTQHGVIPYL